MLTIYLSAQMYDALGDLISAGQMAPGDLFERFIGWARRAAIYPDDPYRGERHGQPRTDHQDGFVA
ncbi:hypothetical protein [Paractinoplanes lichenicola]|uniref:Uncharacterized protein n=1 Tax=Paractinoplanes lichenicola TaxID=2802976 RepID=A0ABS1W5M6_9ACTN|nr:hypothetical protein [Actinoplanes lichenicola]MBL7262041.1 hypothetical protein [Actinoplanes lichenicola]